jgi:predicted AlkP superfamily pyrophosphatase or phosphodiesterase
MTIAPRRFTALRVAASLIVALTIATAPRPEARQGPSRPKLIVILVVDQMRVDYLQWYGSALTRGFARLTRDGAWFTKAAYPYLNTVTCVGHSTIGTGTFPYHHGMILNAWVDRATRQAPGCTDDPAVREISYNGLKTREGDSAWRILRPSLGEQVQRNAHGRAVALSLKPRSSIPLVGHHGDAVVWFDERGGWATSSAFTKRPIPFVQEFVTANPITADHDKVWTKSLDEAAYQGADDVAAERPPAGTTRTFPHPLDVADPAGTLETFFARWQRSPYSDDYLGRMAAASVDALSLGTGRGTDFLGVSFSALDLVGHAFGPRSHEVQDVLVRLDRTIGTLLDHLDRQVGAGNYVVALSADHGVADIPEFAKAGGRQTSKDVRDALEKVLVPVLGVGDHVMASAYTDVYFTSKTWKRLRVDLGLRQKAMDAIAALPAVERVFVGDDLATAEARASSDPITRAAAMSYFPGRSGDLIIAPKQSWILSSSATSHGTSHPYDQRVPVILFGACIRPGRYIQSASPADIAPTLAAAAGVSIRPVDGRVLAEALANVSAK